MRKSPAASCALLALLLLAGAPARSFAAEKTEITFDKPAKDAAAADPAAPATTEKIVVPSAGTPEDSGAENTEAAADTGEKQHAKASGRKKQDSARAKKGKPAGKKKSAAAQDKAPGALASALSLGKFDNWEAAYFDDGGHKVCYMAAAPTSTESSAPVKGRDKNVMLFITHWPADNEKNAVTISAGYSYKQDSKAIVTIGSDSYAMETGGKGTGADPDMSWMKEDKQDDALAEAIQKGETLTVKGTSKRGTVITDTYSLKGSADAYRAISKACGY